MAKDALAGEASGSRKRPMSSRKIIYNKHLGKYRRADVFHWNGLTSSQKKEVVRLEDAAALDDDGSPPLRYRVLTHGFTPSVCRRMLGYVENLADDDAKRREFLETALSVPLGRYAQPFEGAEPKAALETLRSTMDAAVYGHAAAKLEIMRVVAKWMRDPAGKGLSLLLCGPKGVGKTMFAQAGVAAALGMPYTFIALGGSSDASRLLGHGYCYQGSGVGAIAAALIRHQSMSQVMVLDEVDKTADSDRGAAVINTLIHLTDETTNERYHDRYLGDVDLDLSRSLLLFTANDADAISPILRDRMIRIDIGGYSSAERAEIATRHLVPRAISEFGLTGRAADAVASDPFVRAAVLATAAEQGVRDLKRAFKAVCSELNLRVTLDDAYVPTDADVRDILKKATASSEPAVIGMMYN